MIHAVLSVPSLLKGGGCQKRAAGRYLPVMRPVLFLAAALGMVVLLAGCETVPPGVERGPHGTIAYDVLVEATPPGAHIEANGQVVGDAPLHLKIFGDKDGTFHDFGSYYYVVRGLPLTTNQFVQTRVFRTGRWFTPEDRIPDRIYFDMNQNTVPPPGSPLYVYPPYGPPGYYYWPPPYYGPRLHFYFGPGFYHRW
jgi:hypothetical protein